jgi:hypothetical protein
MDVKRLTFDLAVYEVQVTDNWCAPDYAKEHFEKGAFIIHEGVNYHFCTWNGGSEYVYANTIPNDVILGVMAKEIKKSAENALGGVLENIHDRLSQIARLTGECKDEVVKSEARLMDVIVEEGEVRDREFNTLRDGLEALECSRGGGDMGGVNILDVARAAAVIQKPELIKELNK